MGLLAYWIKFSDNIILRRFAWGSSGGAITGLQNFLKDALTLFRISGSVSWLLAFFALMAGATAFSGLLMLTCCMKRYDATYSAASFVGSFVVSASIMSAVHYKTFSDLGSLKDYILYPFGLLVLLIGVLVLVRDSGEPDGENQFRDEEATLPIRKYSDDSQVRDGMDLHVFDLERVPICATLHKSYIRFNSCIPKSKTKRKEDLPSNVLNRPAISGPMKSKRSDTGEPTPSWMI
jgi:hypothetical protein